MILRNALLANPSLELKGNVFFQKGIDTQTPFKRVYLEIRKKEGRLYSDREVLRLPEFHGKSELVSEWKIRSHSSKKLIQHLKGEKPKLILDLGCGNGWLSNLISTSLPAQVLGIDMNETELNQAARVFSQNQNLGLIFADIFSLPISENTFDSVVVASAIQYFPDLKSLLDRLLTLTKSGGGIHIVDSPLYSTPINKEQARLSTIDYYSLLGHPEAAEFYYHHLMDNLCGFDYKILNRPKAFVSRFQNKFFSTESPFPHLLVSKQ